ncbi:MAG TPA: malectin [Opitutaceae bacterium]|nr:malectin [Opitutaceae bacterium]
MKRYIVPLVGALLIASVASAAAADSTAKTIRIKAGVTASHTDEAGLVWQADQGFADGDTVDRGEIAVANTKTPSLYRTERYGMTNFSLPVPNGKYTVKLHFAETFEEITEPGLRVFSFTVGGKEFKDFDVFVKAGGQNRAYVEIVPVEIKDGKLEITFSPSVENPEINAIEIIPAEAEKPMKAET